MIKYYGNQIWNNSTRNSDKQIIYIPATQLQTVINSLDAVGLNYYAYIRSEDKNARLAISKNDLELFKRIDTQERYSEAPRFDREVKAIIGNTAYRDIKNKSYVSYNTDFALKLAEMFTRQGVPFSGRIRRTRDDNSLTTLTFDEKHRNKTELLASQLKAQRAMLNSAAEKLYISGNENINALSDVKGKWLVMPVDEFKAVESNLIGNSISYSAVANGKGIMLYYSAVDENRVLDAVSQNNIRAISMKLNGILTALSLRSSEQLEALQPAAELFLEKYDDETFVDVFSEAFADTSTFSSEQLNEIARKFADEYKNFSGLELLLIPSDIPSLKDKFNKEAMLSELTSERGYTEQQIAEIKKLIDNNVSQSILELIDYTFSPEQIGRVGTAQSYSDIIEVVAEAKHTSAHNIGNYIRLSTYMRETPLDDKDESDFMSETRPTITCEWSEHPAFEDGKTYSVSEFDRMMKKADSEWCENRQKEIDTYGDIDKIFEAYEKGEIDGVHQGYAKTKFTVNMPDGRKFTERQDIGDGYGGVIDFLKLTPHHSEIVKLLLADIESESHNTEADSELTDNVHQDKVSRVDNRSYSSTMQNYFKIKEENPDKLVLLRIGDFYEAMGNDAIVVSQALDLYMTKRRINDNERIDMCGFPVHSFEQYKNRLLSAGHSIEILDEAREYIESQKATTLSEEQETKLSSDIALQTEQKADDIAFADKTFAEQVDDVLAGKVSRYSDLKVCDTPQILLDVGCRQLPMFYTQRHLRDALKQKGNKGESIHYHGLTSELIKNIPSELQNPVLIYDSLSRNDSIVVVTSQTDKDSCPIIAVVRPNGTAKYNLEVIASNFLLSIHGRENFSNQLDLALKSDKILYCNKEKSQALFSVLGLQLSKGLNNLDFDIIIHQSRNIVNERLSENAEKASELAENALQENEIESAPGSISNLFEPAEQRSDKSQEDISSIDEYTPDSNNDDTNFVITDNNTVSGAKTKFRNNINAIKTLKALELNGKAATNADKKALSLYTGWGGLAPAFSENPAWKNEAQELRDLLTADEYVSARASTLDAFYTDNTIIDGIYQAFRNFGFSGGDVLEPAMGIGNFFGRMPSDISRSSRLYGVEKDSVSGRIASKLYPDASITVDGFENTQFQNGSFDVAVGNIPFGDSSVNDKEYNSQHLKIHDYFFLKTLDKVRPGGIVAFVTSKGTLDKKDTSFRKSLAERADLLGAVRLPNNAFKSAGTEVTSDIIFLQKRTAPPEKLPEWVQLGTTSDGLSVNQYFASHPDMVLGKIVQGNKMYGRNDDTMCIPFDDADLSRLLPKAINKISGSYTPYFDKPSPLQDIKNQDVVLPENIRQESYFVHNGELYFWGVAGRDVEITHARELWSNYSTKNAYKKYNNKNIERTKAFVELREIVRELLEVQKLPGDYGQKISELQKALNEKYDAFYSKFGLLHAQQNRLLLSRDSAYPLLLSLEAEVDKGKLVRKSDIFTERTISPPIAVDRVDTAVETLNVSIVSLGKIDLDYMSELCDIPKRVIIEQLRGQIYPVPELSTDDNTVYQTASEYLSGDIYKKLDTAKAAAEANPLFEDNIPALKEAIPTPLKSGDIDVNIGATWIEPKYYQQFIYEVFQTPNEYRADIKPRFPWQRVGKKIEVEYSIYSNKWQITNKSLDKSVTVTKQLGTQFKSAYSIFESVLNLNDPRVYKDAVDKNGKIIFDKSGNPVRVLDVERTKLLQQKANIIKRKFKDWIFKDPKRRSELVAKYNREFNCIKPREFDGSHLTFPGMNSSIELRSHQKNAIAHAIFGGNTLFAHSVGAGKTFEMIATAMECKRLGFCHKSLFAVPNHLTEQIGADFLKLYPGANILVATAKDFTKANRKQLMSKIATGNYDAVIIGHSQLKNLPLSPEIQKKIYQEQIDDILAGIAELKESNGSSFQVKAMERTRKSLQSRLDSLDTQNRDNTVYFDELGIDKLFVDEAHEFKNLFSATKLQNISGISSRASQRATYLFAKCRYLDEKTGGKGVVFATGTPVSNSITEMHTMMRYLQYDFLASHNNMQNFDNWVSTFGKIKVDYELAPAGNKFKERSRVAEYSNMPELMSMFKQVADIRPADTLHLAVPECSLHIVNTKPTELQQSLVAELSARADDVNAGKVDPSVDNMLKITGDGRKVGLDPRLINPDFEDNPETKLNRCVANVLDIYNETAPSKLTQLIFCDLGVPKKDNSLSDSDSADDTLSVSEMDSLEESGAFSVYQDIKDKLIASGVPEKEIAFIHDAHTEAQKAELFYKVRNGDVRILLGSTAKMGTGTNVQNRLVALHDLDVPWRPSDLEQRRGRMVRQGN
ncbi:MAG: LPD25 domain-containing protein, partial [Acutalibacteraceae bacterium]